jgi:hypothetical protein
VPGPSPSLLVIGGAKVGKTHYAGQLLRRLEARKHLLKIAIAPSDRTAFDDVLEKLAVGRSASHTPTNIYKESIWKIWVDGSAHQSELVWPDYGGEQLEDVVRKRQIIETWVQRVRESAGWLFFVRPSLIVTPEMILSRPRPESHMQSAKEAAEGGGPPQNPELFATDADQRETAATQSPVLRTEAALVELLQALLFIKQVGRNAKLSCPVLVVVLSCWDEISSVGLDGKWMDPTQLLMKRLPFLGQFIASTWEQNRLRVFGLSALGKSLKEDVDDDAFVDNGPERQGWCITDAGVQREDLTMPVLSLLNLMTDRG